MIEKIGQRRVDGSLEDHMIIIQHDSDRLEISQLVDQLYDTRQRLLSLTAAVTAQDKNVQAAIIAAMEPNGGSSEADKS